MCMRSHCYFCTSVYCFAFEFLWVLKIPSFDRIVEFIGSFCSFTVSVIFPCACYLKLHGSRISFLEKMLNVLIVIGGVACAIMGTYLSIVGQ